jgi:hypothetical protein
MMTVAPHVAPTLLRVDAHADPLRASFAERGTLVDGNRIKTDLVTPAVTPQLASPVVDESASAKDGSPFKSEAGRRGRHPKKLEQVKEAMRGDIRDGKRTAESLGAMLEKELENTYGASRDTTRKARAAVLSEIVGK